MLDTPVYAWDDLEGIAALVRDHPWAVVVSVVAGQAVMSHTPILLDTVGADSVTIATHLGRHDGELHRLGEVPMTVVVSGPNGYVSPSWYPTGTYVPTWNYVVTHLSGRAEALAAEATWDVLVRTVERFEDERSAPWSLDRSLDDARRIAPGTVGFRLTTERIEAKAKLSQDKPDEVIRSVVQALATDPVHGNPELADTMRAHLPHLFAEGRA